MLSFLPKERMILITIIIVMGAVIALGGIWFNAKYTVLAVEKEDVERIAKCTNNEFACDLVKDYSDELPE